MFKAVFRSASGFAALAVLAVSANACVKAKVTTLDLKKVKVDSVFLSTNLSTCAKDDKANLYCWGDNRFGQLGILDDGWTQSALPMDQVQPDFTQLALGDEHTCGVTGDGALYCWGKGDAGRLGVGKEDIQVDPIKVGLDSVKSVAVNSRHSCAIDESETLSCWGLNDRGSLGVGATDGDKRTMPTQVALPNVKKVALGPDFTCAIAQGGTLYCWGNSADGRLGLGDGATDQNKPAKVDVPPVQAVSLGDSYGCAVTKANELYCWGNNKKGQLGLTDPKVVKPTKVDKLTKVIQVAAGQDAGRPHTCALGSDGRVYCAGAGDAVGQGGAAAKTFTRVANVTGVTDIASGRARTCAVTDKWDLYCWGATAGHDEIDPKASLVIGPP